MRGRIAQFDMDDTLFDFSGTMIRDLKVLAAPEEHTELDKVTNIRELEDWPYLKARMDMIKRVPGWWRDLPRYEPGWEIYELTKSIGFCCKILTKGPWSKPHAWAEKHECIMNHFGEDVEIGIVSGQTDKGNMYGRILVEDHPPYLLAWLQHRSRGLGIIIDHPSNRGFEHDNVVRYDGTNLEEVRTKLQAAYDRESKQHWKELMS